MDIQRFNTNASLRPAMAFKTAFVLAFALPALADSTDLVPPPAQAASIAYAPRSSPLPEAFQDGVNIAQFPPATAADSEAADQLRSAKYGHIHPGPARVGFLRQTLLAPIAPGSITALRTLLPDGGEMRTVAVDSPGAYGQRLHLTNVNLGTATLITYAYDADGTVIVRGPYTGRGPDERGDFWTSFLPGERVFLEVSGGDNPIFDIPEIVHFDHDPSGGGDTRGGALSCNLDVMCETDVTSCARQATGQMNFVDGASFVCTGTLIADFDSNTEVPYFLTANHCIDSQSVMNTLEVVWFWQRSSCNGSLPSYSSLPRSEGGALLATSGANPGNDATFARLNGAVPAGGCLVQATQNEELGVFGVHHPRGDWKRAHFGHYESLSTGCGLDCACFTPTNYAFYQIDRGVMEPGSSGSGMFDAQGRILGQLFGNCTLCPDAYDCFHVGDWCLMYGEWAQTYPDVQFWMFLGGTVHVDDSNLTPPWSGTPADPCRTVAQGQAVLWNADGLRMVIDAGNYPEVVTLNRRVTVTATGGVARIGDLP
jgi:lysyl endopeptidase